MTARPLVKCVLSQQVRKKLLEGTVCLLPEDILSVAERACSPEQYMELLGTMGHQPVCLVLYCVISFMDLGVSV